MTKSDREFIGAVAICSSCWIAMAVCASKSSPGFVVLIAITGFIGSLSFIFLKKGGQ